MKAAAPKLVLASQSPRRAELLTQMGLPFEVVVADIDESRQAGESPHAYVERLAVGKAETGWALAGEDAVVIGADTVVVLEGEILGKPANVEASREMLEALSGRVHTVFTGVHVYTGERGLSAVVQSDVTFRKLSAYDIEQYCLTGEGADKAGSYGIQGIGGILVERIEGSFSAVMGLPVLETERLLRELDIDTWSMRSRWQKNSL